MVPTQVVEAVIAEFNRGNPGMYSALEQWFTPQTVWENVALAVTTGIREAQDLIRQLEQAMGIDAIAFETLAIASHGNRVLTERIDRMLAADGSEIRALRVMGIFEVDRHRITAWRDCFDSASAQRLLKA